jgi:FAD/FMN-containing dehydrogenase
MRDIRIDPRRRIARVQAGTLWLEVVRAEARRPGPAPT